MGQVAALSLVYLPQQGKAAETEPGLVGVEKGVNAGQAMRQDIHCCHSHQLFFKPEFHKLSIGPGAGQKLHVFVFTGVVHAAASVAGCHVFAIEREVLVNEAGFYRACFDFSIFT